MLLRFPKSALPMSTVKSKVRAGAFCALLPFRRHPSDLIRYGVPECVLAICWKRRFSAPAREGEGALDGVEAFR